MRHVSCFSSKTIAVGGGGIPVDATDVEISLLCFYILDFRQSHRISGSHSGDVQRNLTIFIADLLLRVNSEDAKNMYNLNLNVDCLNVTFKLVAPKNQFCHRRYSCRPIPKSGDSTEDCDRLKLYVETSNSLQKSVLKSKAINPVTL